MRNRYVDPPAPDRCRVTELALSQCAHCVHPHLPTPPEVDSFGAPVRVENSARSRFSGRIEAEEPEHIPPDEDEEREKRRKEERG